MDLKARALLGSLFFILFSFSEEKATLALLDFHPGLELEKKPLYQLQGMLHG